MTTPTNIFKRKNRRKEKELNNSPSNIKINFKKLLPFIIGLLIGLYLIRRIL
jgi:hypothetical protein